SSSSVLDRSGGVGSGMRDSIQAGNLQAPLKLLAERTGGQATVNTNDVGPALERLATDLGTYYSLGYRPARHSDGRYHRISVEVKRKGLQVRHRDGYRDEPPEERMSRSVMAGLKFGRADNPLGVLLEPGTAQRLADGNYRVDLRVLLPVNRLTIVPL